MRSDLVGLLAGLVLLGACGNSTSPLYGGGGGGAGAAGVEGAAVVIAPPSQSVTISLTLRQTLLLLDR